MVSPSMQKAGREADRTPVYKPGSFVLCHGRIVRMIPTRFQKPTEALAVKFNQQLFDEGEKS